MGGDRIYRETRLRGGMIRIPRPWTMDIFAEPGASACRATRRGVDADRRGGIA